MAGAFPCLMPREDHVTAEGEPLHREYTLYHAKYTILGSFSTPAAAQNVLADLGDKTKYDEFIARYRPLFEEAIKKFYPEFAHRFEFSGVDTAIASKFTPKIAIIKYCQLVIVSSPISVSLGYQAYLQTYRNAL